jgi:hypothetical protein
MFSAQETSWCFARWQSHQVNPVVTAVNQRTAAYRNFSDTSRR